MIFGWTNVACSIVERDVQRQAALVTAPSCFRTQLVSEVVMRTSSVKEQLQEMWALCQRGRTTETTLTAGRGRSQPPDQGGRGPTGPAGPGGPPGPEGPGASTPRSGTGTPAVGGPVASTSAEHRSSSKVRAVMRSSVVQATPRLPTVRKPTVKSPFGGQVQSSRGRSAAPTRPDREQPVSVQTEAANELMLPWESVNAFERRFAVFFYFGRPHTRYSYRAFS